MPDAASAARRPGLAVLGMLLWLVATVLVAAAPLLYFVAGAGDDASDGDRILLALVPIGLAWPLLAASIGVAQRAHGRPPSAAIGVGALRALLLLLAAGAMFELARRLASPPTISGDAAWAAYWVACGAVWLVLSRCTVAR